MFDHPQDHHNYHLQISHQLDPRVTPRAEDRINLFHSWYLSVGEKILMHYLRHKLFDKTLTGDIAQSTYIRLCEILVAGRFHDEKKPFTGYVKMVAFNLIKEKYREERKYQAMDEEVLDYLAEPMEIYDELDLHISGPQVVKHLIGHERIVMWNLLFNGRSLEEVAKSLKLSLENVYKIKSRALKRLKSLT